MAEDQVELRVALEAGELKFQLVRTPEIVMIQETQKLAHSRAYARVPRRRMALLLLFNHPDFGSVPSHRLRGGIGGAVIDHQNFDRPVLLRENAVERGADVPDAVVRRDYDGDQAVHWFAPSGSPM